MLPCLLFVSRDQLSHSFTSVEAKLLFQVTVIDDHWEKQLLKDRVQSTKSLLGFVADCYGPVAINSWMVDRELGIVMTVIFNLLSDGDPP